MRRRCYPCCAGWPPHTSTCSRPLSVSAPAPPGGGTADPESDTKRGRTRRATAGSSSNARWIHRRRRRGAARGRERQEHAGGAAGPVSLRGHRGPRAPTARDEGDLPADRGEGGGRIHDPRIDPHTGGRGDDPGLDTGIPQGRFRCIAAPGPERRRGRAQVAIGDHRRPRPAPEQQEQLDLLLSYNRTLARASSRRNSARSSGRPTGSR